MAGSPRPRHLVSIQLARPDQSLGHLLAFAVQDSLCVCLDYYVRSLLTAGLANAMQISKFAIKRTIFIFKMAHECSQGGMKIACGGARRWKVRPNGGLAVKWGVAGTEACT